MQKTILGRTGLEVSRIGIGASYGIDDAGLRRAFERGINFFYFGTMRTREMARAVGEIAAAGQRDRLVVAIQSYSSWGWYLRKSVDKALRKLKLEFADLLILGKKDQPVTGALLEQALKVKESGKVRFLVVSAHRRAAFQEHMRSGNFGAIMVRYNAAHPGAEKEVFPFVPVGRSAEDRPGVISYTATRWGTLLQPVPGEAALTAADCYRFVLSNPSVDVCMTGPQNGQELEAAFQAADMPPFSGEDLDRLRRIGSVIHGRNHHNWLLRKLIFD